MGIKEIKTYEVTCDYCNKLHTHSSYKSSLPEDWKQFQLPLKDEDIRGGLESFSCLIMGNNGLGYYVTKICCPACASVEDILK